MSIMHIVWIFDLAGADTQFKNRDDTLQTLYGNYLANCLDDGISFASGTWVTSNTIIAPGKFDAVVFVVTDVNASVGAHVGGNVQNLASNALGNTVLGATGGGVAEVYWDRCFNNDEVAQAIFHEAAHLKSNQGEGMHTARRGLRVLRKDGSSFKFPSWDDLEFYSAAIKQPVTLRRRVP